MTRNRTPAADRKAQQTAAQRPPRQQDPPSPVHAPKRGVTSRTARLTVPTDPFRDLDRPTSPLVSGTRTPAPMPMDAWRSADDYHGAQDLPGVDPGSTELTVERNP